MHYCPEHRVTSASVQGNSEGHTNLASPLSLLQGVLQWIMSSTRHALFLCRPSLTGTAPAPAGIWLLHLEINHCQVWRIQERCSQFLAVRVFLFRLKILGYAAFLPVCPLSSTEISVKAFLQTDEEIKSPAFYLISLL